VVTGVLGIEVAVGSHVGTFDAPLLGIAHAAVDDEVLTTVSSTATSPMLHAKPLVGDDNRPR
jgi:hypothetical protein